jgi:hypothetical protein
MAALCAAPRALTDHRGGGEQADRRDDAAGGDAGGDDGAGEYDEDEEGYDEDEEEEEYDSDEGSPTPPPWFPVRPGGPAAFRVYRTAELRDLILRRMDDDTLSTMMRLEKRLEESVARVLYEYIPMKLMKKMGRNTVSGAVPLQTCPALWVGTVPAHHCSVLGPKLIF